MRTRGIVYIIGAGPGDPDLITERGRRLLSRADLILYDRLVNPALLLHARQEAEMVSVGKRPGDRGKRQAEINELIARAARRGKVVVRLKGGDPMLFGRGGEEALSLLKKKIPFVIVPGVSSALAVPAAAGIPLTLRGMSSAVTIVTGHEADLGKGVDWNRLLRADSTFVVLMGVGNLERITGLFLAAGKNPRLPAALVENGCTPLQRTVTGTLGTIAFLGMEAGIAPPAILVVGEVVRLCRVFSKSRYLPLNGMRVLVARPLHQSGNLEGLLREKGAAVLLCPLIEIRPPRSFSALDRAVRNLGRYDWIIFMSANGVRSVMDRLRRCGLDARALAGVRACAIGPATGMELLGSGIGSDFMPREYSSEGIVRALAAMGEVNGRRFLVPRSSLADGYLRNALEKGGGDVHEVAAYRTVVSGRGMRRARDLLLAGAADIVVLTSPSVARAYARVLKEISKRKFRRPRCVAIGPVTTRAAREGGVVIAAEARSHTDDGIARAIVQIGKERR